MENLFEIYAKEYPHEPRETLREKLKKELLTPLSVIHAAGDASLAKSYSGDAMLARAYANEMSIDSEFLFAIACSYWVEAGVTVPHDRETAWSYAIEAMYYCGTAKSWDGFNRALPILSEKICAEARRVTSVNASDARKRLLAEIGREAVRLVRLRGESGERWINHLAAAKSVLPEVSRFASKKGQPFYASDGGARTIANYLKAARELNAYIEPGNRRRRG